MQTKIYFTKREKDVLNLISKGLSNKEISGELLVSINTVKRNILIKDNIINNGNFAISLKGPSFSTPTKKLIIQGNTITNSYSGGVELYYCDSVTIASNTITTTSTNPSYYGLKLMGVRYNGSIYNNKIYGSVGSYGMYLQYCQGTQALPFYVYNNMVQIGGTTLTYGIYSDGGDSIVFAYNSVNVTSSGTTSIAFKIQGILGGTQTYRNNIFANTGGGYAFYTTTLSVINSSNYNDFYTSGSVLANNGTSDLTDLTDLTMWTDSTGLDTNSLSVNPLFFSATDLHTCQYLLDGAGNVNSNFTTDFDNETRDPSTPDIGADEFSSNFTNVPVTICSNSSYQLPGGTYVNTSGVYIDIFTVANGCDSVIQTTLTVNAVDTSINLTGNTLTANATTAACQWLDCNNNYATIIGENSQNYTATVNGSYAVEVTQNGCTDTSACYNIIGVGVSINNFGNSFSIFPNPTNSKLNIHFNDLFTGNIEISTIKGERIYSKKLQNINQTIIQVDEFSKGIYFLQLTTNTSTYQTKLIIN